MRSRYGKNDRHHITRIFQMMPWTAAILRESAGEEGADPEPEDVLLASARLYSRLTLAAKAGELVLGDDDADFKVTIGWKGDEFDITVDDRDEGDDSPMD